MLTSIRDWASAVVPLFNLLLILIAANKVLNKAEQDYNDRGKRLTDCEDRLRTLESDAKLVIGMAAKVDDMHNEIARLRNRLDTFLDLRKSS